MAGIALGISSALLITLWDEVAAKLNSKSAAGEDEERLLEKVEAAK